jgi:hypothetical protein
MEDLKPKHKAEIKKLGIDMKDHHEEVKNFINYYWNHEVDEPENLRNELAQLSREFCVKDDYKPIPRNKLIHERRVLAFAMESGVHGVDPSKVPAEWHDSGFFKGLERPTGLALRHLRPELWGMHGHNNLDEDFWPEQTVPILTKDGVVTVESDGKEERYQVYQKEIVEYDEAHREGSEIDVGDEETESLPDEQEDFSIQVSDEENEPWRGGWGRHG